YGVFDSNIFSWRSATATGSHLGSGRTDEITLGASCRRRFWRSSTFGRRVDDKMEWGGNRCRKSSEKTKRMDLRYTSVVLHSKGIGSRPQRQPTWTYWQLYRC